MAEYLWDRAAKAACIVPVIIGPTRMLNQAAIHKQMVKIRDERTRLAAVVLLPEDTIHRRRRVAVQRRKPANGDMLGRVGVRAACRQRVGTHFSCVVTKQVIHDDVLKTVTVHGPGIVQTGDGDVCSPGSDRKAIARKSWAGARAISAVYDWVQSAFTRSLNPAM